MKQVCLILRAGWGDGSEEIIVGEISPESKAYLETIASELPELLKVSSTVQKDPELGQPLVDYVKWWILGGEDDLFEETKGMSAEEFVKFARQTQ